MTEVLTRCLTPKLSYQLKPQPLYTNLERRLVIYGTDSLTDCEGLLPKQKFSV